MKQTAKRYTRARSSITSAKQEWKRKILTGIFLELRFAQMGALRTCVSRYALLPANPSVLQATGVPSQVIGCWEQVKIKRHKKTNK